MPDTYGKGRNWGISFAGALQGSSACSRLACKSYGIAWVRVANLVSIQQQTPQMSCCAITFLSHVCDFPLCCCALPLQVPAAVTAAQDAAEQQPLAKWVTRPDGGLELQTGHAVKHIAWHARGDYFASVAPTGNTQVGCFASGTWQPRRKRRLLMLVTGFTSACAWCMPGIRLWPVMVQNFTVCLKPVGTCWHGGCRQNPSTEALHGLTVAQRFLGAAVILWCDS